MGKTSKRTEPAKDTIIIAPFPPMTWDESWQAEIALPSWSDFFIRAGGGKSSKGKVKLIMNAEGNKALPTDPQIAAYKHLLKHEKTMQRAILKAIAEYYPARRQEMIEQYGLDEADAARWFPPIRKPADLRTIICLRRLYLQRTVLDGCAYFGFDFNCTWDKEHGLGVVVHRNRVAVVGEGADAFMEWVSRRDVEKNAMPNEAASPATPRKRRSR